MKEELIEIMSFIRDERKNILGEDDERKCQRLDEVLSIIHEKLNRLENLTKK